MYFHFKIQPNDWEIGTARRIQSNFKDAWKRKMNKVPSSFGNDMIYYSKFEKMDKESVFLQEKNYVNILIHKYIHWKFYSIKQPVKDIQGCHWSIVPWTFTENRSYDLIENLDTWVRTIALSIWNIFSAVFSFQYNLW